MAAVVIPVVYGAGFWGWSMHFASQDMGFYSLPPQQYLSAGIVFSAFFAPILLAEIAFGTSTLRRKHGVVGWTGCKNALLFGVMRFSIFYITFLPISMILKAAGISRMEFVQAGVMAIAIGGLVGVVGLLSEVIFAISTALAFRFFRWRNRRKARQPLVKIEQSYQSLAAPIYCRILLALTVVWWLLIGASAFGTVLLGKVSSEFGGAEARHAILSMNPSNLPLGERNELFAPGLANGTSVVVTQHLEIRLLTDQVVVVRSLDKDPETIEINRGLVSSIYWINSQR